MTWRRVQRSLSCDEYIFSKGSSSPLWMTLILLNPAVGGDDDDDDDDIFSGFCPVLKFLEFGGALRRLFS